MGVGSSNLTLSDQAEAHLSSQLPLVHVLQRFCRDSEGCRTRSGTDGDESSGRGVARGGAVDVGRGLCVCVRERHAMRSRESRVQIKNINMVRYPSFLIWKVRIGIAPTAEREVPRWPGLHVCPPRRTRASRLGTTATVTLSLGFQLGI